MRKDSLDSSNTELATWTETQPNEVIAPNAHRDAIVPARHSRRAIWVRWPKVKDHLASVGRLSSGQQKKDFTVGNGRIGLMFLQSSEDAWELLRVGLPNYDAHVQIDKIIGLARWGITGDIMGGLAVPF